ncbi:MAG: acyl-CoA dehydrogenase family protein, partial [bacterium]|nr:acyl-CoA dehydrogenase family protein [bacterium]
MDLDFNSEQNMLRETAAKFFVKECPFETVKDIEESDTGYSKELWSKMAELGWMGVFFPEEYGGYGGQFIDVSIIMEEMGKAALPSPFFSTVIQCGSLIMEGASEDQKKELLGKISEGSLIMALAQYEQEVSYFSSGINMTAELSG